MKSLLHLVAIVITIALTRVLAAQDVPSQYEHLKMLEDHIGTWVGEMESQQSDGMIPVK